MAHAEATGWSCREPECRGKSGGPSGCRYPTGDFQVNLKQSELEALIAEKVEEERRKLYTRKDMDYIYEVGKREGWDEGYDACYQGKQRHSPYKKY